MLGMMVVLVAVLVISYLLQSRNDDDVVRIDDYGDYKGKRKPAVDFQLVVVSPTVGVRPCDHHLS